MNKSPLHDNFLPKLKHLNLKLKQTLSRIGHLISSQLHHLYSITKLATLELWHLLQHYYEQYPYPIIGVSLCGGLWVSYWMWKKVWGRKVRLPRPQEKALTDQESTYQSLESGQKSDDNSFLSIKLPMDEILESENEDDGEDKIFFQVYKNYRHT